MVYEPLQHLASSMLSTLDSLVENILMYTTEEEELGDWVETCPCQRGSLPVVVWDVSLTVVTAFELKLLRGSATQLFVLECLQVVFLTGVSDFLRK